MVRCHHVLHVELNRLTEWHADTAFTHRVAVKRVTGQRPVQCLQITGGRRADQVRILGLPLALIITAPVIHADHAAPKLPGQRRIGAAVRAEQLIHPLHAFIHHPTVDHHLNLNVINAVRQVAGIHLMVAHGKVLHAQQSSLARQMHFPRRGEERHDRRQRLAVIKYGGVGAVTIRQTIDLAGVDGSDRPQRL
ncbi:hypothetical protein D3C81_1017830 [compost metagenome]